MLLFQLISLVLFFYWLNLIKFQMNQSKKLFINDLVIRRMGSSIGSIQGFVIGSTGSSGKRALVIILFVILFPIFIALIWIFSIPGVIYAIYKNVKYKPFTYWGLTPFGVFVAYAAPLICFPLVPGIIIIRRLISGFLLNRIGLGWMIVVRTASSYIFLPILDDCYFDFGNPSILPLTQCKASVVSCELKKTKIEFSIGSDKKVLTILPGQSFSIVSQKDGIDVLFTTVEDLITDLKNENAYVRRDAAILIGKTKDSIAIKPLLQALKDPEWYVQDYAYEALEEITGKDFGKDYKKWNEWWNQNQGNFSQKK